jgi:hypothetical protein
MKDFYATDQLLIAFEDRVEVRKRDFHSNI